MASKILTVVGARPQFVKAATVSRALAEAGLEEYLVHTGQHYDWEMSEAFFEGLNIPAPAINLEVGSASHGAQTGRMLQALEAVVQRVAPDVVLVYGDTNSTMAGALAAVKLHVPVAHVEAGLRSFNRRMPEEINRVVTDHVSSLLFAPTDVAVRNLGTEGVTKGVIRTGDVMYDLARQTASQLESAKSTILARWGLDEGGYVVVTIHRAENTDDSDRWKAIVAGLKRIATSGRSVLWPAHPRTRSLLENVDSDGLQIVDPLPYLDMQTLIRFARVVLTDSGGVQKEAAFRETPCRTLRTETEWTELVDCGVNVLVETAPEAMIRAVEDAAWPETGLPPELYGNGETSQFIARTVAEFTGEV